MLFLALVEAARFAGLAGGGGEAEAEAERMAARAVATPGGRFLGGMLLLGRGTRDVGGERKSDERRSAVIDLDFGGEL